jgi:3',5'-cyclic AMP phosphodiesterase CpdA
MELVMKRLALALLTALTATTAFGPTSAEDWLDRPFPPQPITAIMMGDMNFTHYSPKYTREVSDVSEQCEHTLRAHRLADAWTLAGHPESARDTIPRAGDWDAAAAQMRRFSAKVTKLVPGNHDVGYSPAALSAEQRMAPERRQNYLERVGPDFWQFDYGDWRFIGLNPFLLESGFDAEAEQRAMVFEALSYSGPIGVFTHVPFFSDHPNEVESDTTDTVTPGPRADYLGLFRAANVRFVASGHIHRNKRVIGDGITHIWAPGTAFMQSTPSPLGGVPWVGFLEMTFSGERFSIVTHEPEDMINMDLRNWSRGSEHRYFRIVEHPHRSPV